MKKVYGLVVVALVVLAAVAAKPVRAYFVSKTLASDQSIVMNRWDKSTFPIQWQMYPTQGSNVTGSRTLSDVLNKSLGAWPAVAPVTIQQGPNTTTSVQVPQYDGFNTITTNGTVIPMPSGVLALTYVFTADAPGGPDQAGKTATFSGQIMEADMAFNTAYPFSLNDSGPGSNATDLQSVATHEAGHFFGMDHASNVSSTMFWTTPQGYINQRNLTSDDIAGISTLYPPSNFATKGTLNGTVRTTGNVPVYGAIVVAVNSTGVPVASTVTDPSGNYTIQGLAAGSYTVYAEPLSGRIGVTNIYTLGGQENIYPCCTVNTNFTTRWH